MLHRFIRFAALSALLMVRAAAESWSTTQGAAIEGRLSRVYGDLVVITRENGSAILPLEHLDDASLLKVADFLAKPPTPEPSSWELSSSKVAKSLANRLVTLQDRKFVPFQLKGRPEPEFYLVYFGAYWCGPCRRFSPRLLETYRRLKQVAPERFEVVFVSDDTDEGEQFKYARELGMPWPILKYSSAGRVPVFDQWRGGGIPCLVVLTREGELLYHSYRGKEYLGADAPLEKFAVLLEATQPNAQPTRSPGRHRLATAQAIRAAGQDSRPPQPYLITLDPRQVQAAAVPGLTAQLMIDARGRVTSAEFTPALGAAIDDMMQRAASNWLFVPAIADGRARASTIKVPLEIKRP